MHSKTVFELVREVLPLIRDRADDTDRAARVPEPTMSALISAGFFRMLQPARVGGYESNPLDFYRIVRRISSACPNTGWVAAIVGVHPWQIALFSPQAQDDVWGDDPDTLVSSSYAPVGQVCPVRGGYELRGRWSFSSGCDHCQWALLGAMCTREGADPEYLTLLIPRSDYTVHAVWDSVGLRGTGSNDIVVEGAFVPDHRVLSARDWTQLRGPGHQVNHAPLYRLAMGSVFPTTITMSIIGAAEGFYQEHTDWVRSRVRISDGKHAVDDPFVHVRSMRAASDIDAATLQVEHNIAEQLAYAQRGDGIPYHLRLRTRRDQTLGTDRVVRAVEELFTRSGATALSSAGPMASFWRHVHAGSVHVVNDWPRVLSQVGRAEFGATVDDPWI
ncbi:flavin-dependent monooxygenase [Nocardia asteroides]|uniref:3-hydroxy-9,10-secoandrosta-1,3,5(10)-triene-9, 17-dione monooxygenase oxygenase subunit n=1 Tax=Nocardia TaxID=1817 RepID=UPI00135A0B41|nr:MULTISPECIES: 3-hydroxy-9,10-secoandrosta-1,3,5(10)-triene-9,17-dione monooxygenase oxygenase subunit [Nocardia]MBF6208846.1 flavin-dependent monooxygenase [Streptomyces gardneri]UAK31421.1 flavin-dependent monooxygenase [Nocardia asteroides]